jgi:Glycosyl hydrolase family 10
MSKIRFLRRLATSGLALGLSLVTTGCGGAANKGTTTTTSSAVSTAPSPSSIPASYFGMHENNAAGINPWPLVTFGSFRGWDAYQIKWSDLEPSRGRYNWAPLDDYINALNSRGVTDILYTFGHTPSWAAAQDCLPPTNNQDMLDFVTAIATHANGKIKHWETWNEPYSTTFWCGTLAQLVTLQNDVYDAVKSIDVTATVHTPVVGFSSVPNDCNNSAGGTYGVYNFLASNGTSNFDIVDVHMYAYPAGSAPENSGVWMANLKCTLNTYGIGTIPIWNTEFSWGLNTYLPSASDQVAYVARSHIYYWSLGIARSYWYAYNNDTWGTIFNGTSLNAAGVAYQEVYQWMVGATMTTPCTVASGVWTCGFRLANGNIGEAVWLDAFQSASTQSYTPGGTHNKYHDLTGGTATYSGSVTISEKPLLLEGGAATLSLFNVLHNSDFSVPLNYSLAFALPSPIPLSPEASTGEMWMRGPALSSISTIVSVRPPLRHEFSANARR